MSKPTIAELLAQKAAIEKQIIEAQRGERSEVVAKVRALMAEYGLTLADIGSKVVLGSKVTQTRKTAFPAPAVKMSRSSKGKKTGKVAPKYRDVTTGQTWSGRGLQPNWLKAALATGRTIAEFKL